MTLKQLISDLRGDEAKLGELERMTDEELLAYLRPHLLVTAPLKTQKTDKIIDVSGAVERSTKKAENVNDFIERMTKMMNSKMASME